VRNLATSAVGSSALNGVSSPAQLPECQQRITPTCSLLEALESGMAKNMSEDSVHLGGVRQAKKAAVTARDDRGAL
jgi:hypothetical protein